MAAHDVGKRKFALPHYPLSHLFLCGVEVFQGHGEAGWMENPSPRITGGIPSRSPCLVRP